ncbi:MAG TPA: hypothetical protein VGO45_02155 [Bacteroidia bacterium]|jgi:hypothetical protein|nr:hypothetical protein [Bacteroidia bacterium]
MEEVYTKTAAYSFLEEGLLVCRMLENAEVNAEEVDENFELTMKLANGKRYVVLVDARTTVHMSKEGMERANRPETYKYLIAQAIVVDSLPNRLVGNFIIKFHKPTSPTRLFSTMESATIWLRKCLQEDKKATADPSRKSRRTLLW